MTARNRNIVNKVTPVGKFIDRVKGKHGMVDIGKLIGVIVGRTEFMHGVRVSFTNDHGRQTGTIVGPLIDLTPEFDKPHLIVAEVLLDWALPDGNTRCLATVVAERSDGSYKRHMKRTGVDGSADLPMYALAY